MADQTCRLGIDIGGTFTDVDPQPTGLSRHVAPVGCDARIRLTLPQDRDDPVLRSANRYRVSPVIRIKCKSQRSQRWPCLGLQSIGFRLTENRGKAVSVYSPAIKWHGSRDYIGGQ